MRFHEILYHKDAKISAFYLNEQNSFVPKKICDIIVSETFKSKISDFPYSNTCLKLETIQYLFGKNNQVEKNSFYHLPKQKKSPEHKNRRKRKIVFSAPLALLFHQL